MRLEFDWTSNPTSSHERLQMQSLINSTNKLQCTLVNLILSKDVNMKWAIIGMEVFEENAWFSATESDPMHFSAVDKLIIAQRLSATKRKRVCLKCTGCVEAASDLRKLALAGQTEITSTAFSQHLNTMLTI